MNDRPSSGLYPESGYDGLSTSTFAGDSSYASYETQGQGYAYTSYGAYDTGSYDTTAWASQGSYPQDGYLPTVPAQGASADTAAGTGQWDTTAWTTQTPDYQSTAAAFGYEQTGQWAMPGYGTTGTETGSYDATAWNTVPQDQQQTQTFSFEFEQQPQPQPQPAYAYQESAAVAADAYTETAVFEALGDEAADAALDSDHQAPDPGADLDLDLDLDAESDLGLVAGPVHDMPTQAMPVTPAASPAGSPSGPRASRRAGAKAKAPHPSGNSRRRTPAKRSALLTVAVPSACVMGIAGVAAASVGGLTGGDKPAEDTTTVAAPDPASVKPVAANSKLDTQLEALSADAGDFADRASRTQERIDLRQRQDEERKRKAAEEAAKEAARPKFALPVAQHGLSASFGQAGGMWMSVHTGIDFPVGYGTPVMAATDGTVRTQWNSAYGNMAIVTSPDGTETWYCHLGSTKIRSGKVKAGDVIAYSGNSGNSTGPHLHFEVRPGGGSAVDPAAWLRSHGLNPN
ncbi:M23 family metallopeptidase [Streptomyces sp. NPDC127106]|uniref:M23 family metallopeptidase n=1 Tax=Streptomyces sp. NPDC127106 TaxID=3345360 RepID=UPI0036436E77